MKKIRIKIAGERTNKISDSEEFKKISVTLIIKSIRATNLGENEEFINEIRYLLHYLFLVLEDDYKYGDKVFPSKLTQIDNYIFSDSINNEKLQENIDKLKLLATTKRFSKDSKQNLLEYFVFLEEIGIEIMDLLRDFLSVLSPKRNIFDVLFNLKSQKLKEFIVKKMSRKRKNKPDSKSHTMS